MTAVQIRRLNAPAASSSGYGLTKPASSRRSSAAKKVEQDANGARWTSTCQRAMMSRD